MTDSPDPLGKRALFWAPAERDESGPRRAAERDVPGKHALFSDEARASAAQARPVASLERVAKVPHHDRRFGAGRGLVSPIGVDCSACGVRSEIHLAEFVVLHLPIWLWRPGRGYTRFMTCPSCRRRTWVSASWAPWAR
jgi:hypothetical protein